MSDPEVLFVCWGNICRSPMAEVVAKDWAHREGLAHVTFTSAGVSNEESGNPMDPRAVATLTAAGYRPEPHTARLVTRDEVDGAAMVIGMERTHLRRIRQLDPEAGALYLLTTTAPDYFRRLGFRALARRHAPAALRESAEFRGACPDSALLMELTLRAAPPAQTDFRRA